MLTRMLLGNYSSVTNQEKKVKTSVLITSQSIQKKAAVQIKIS